MEKLAARQLQRWPVDRLDEAWTFPDALPEPSADGRSSGSTPAAQAATEP